MTCLRFVDKCILVILCACFSLGGGQAWGAPSYQNVGLLPYGPAYVVNSGAGITASNVTTTAILGTRRCGYIFMVPKDGTLDSVCFKIHSITDTTGGVWVRAETVGADGKPSGTLFGANSEDTIYVTGGTTDVGYKWARFTTKPTVAAGNMIAIVARAGGLNADFTVVRAMGSGQPGGNLPYTASYVASWTVDDLPPAVGVAISGAITPCGTLACDTISVLPTATTGYSNSTTPDEIGLEFKNKIPMKIGGFGGRVRHIGASDKIDLIANLYNASGTLVVACTTGVSTATGLDFQVWDHQFRFDEQTIPADEFWTASVTFFPTGVRDTVFFDYVFKCHDTARWVSTGFSSDWRWTSRTDGGAWTDDATTRPPFWLLVTALSADAGGVSGRRRKIINGLGLVREATETFAGSVDELVR